MASTLGSYLVRLRDQSGNYVAVFDNWVRLTYTNELNGICKYQFTISGDDDRITYFELDGQIEVWRRIAGIGIDWYIDFEGLHRKTERITSTTGERVFVSTGVGYNDFLARTVIGYKEGTIRAEKNGPAESVMKAYVAENCTLRGNDATVVGRLNYDEHLNDGAGGLVYDSALPGFSVQHDQYGGPTWAGERAYENLLSTLQDISETTGVDFKVIGAGEALFSFRTYVNGYGLDRRFIDVDALTGLNQAGNTPVMFSVPFNTVKEISYVYDRLREANAIMVLGKGDSSTREVYTVADPEVIDDSPWNRREITRPGSNQEFDYQYRQLGDEILHENKANETMDFDPIDSETLCYGAGYNVGDYVTAQYDEIMTHKRITKITITSDERGEKINLEFADKPQG